HSLLCVILSFTLALFAVLSPLLSFHHTAPPAIYTLSLHDALPIFGARVLELDHGLHLAGHRLAGLLGESLRIRVGLTLPVLDGDLGGQVAQRVVRGGLVGDHVDVQITGPVALEQGGEDVRRVADDADRQPAPLRLGGVRSGDRVLEVVGDLVAVALGDAALEAGAVHVHDQAHAVVEGDRQRLRPAHSAAAAGERDGAGEGAAEALPRDRGEGLVGALEDALGGDVDPGPGGHLAVHHQPLG